MQSPCMMRCFPTRHSCGGVAASSPAGKASTRADRLNSIMRATRLLASVEHFIMDGMFVEAGKHGPGGRGDVAGGVILSHEGADAVQAVEPHQSLELDLIADFAPHQVDVAEPRDAACFYAGYAFPAADPLIGRGAFWTGPAAPQPADHQDRKSTRLNSSH